ncbi:28774_t:CDS:2, partial [Racocetra persica]
RSHEDGAYFFARVFRDLVLDENFVAFRWNFLAFFFQALKDWSWERDAKKLEELEKKIVTTFQLGKALENTKKFVKVSNAVRVFLNCFSAAVIITLAAVTSSEEAKKTFCVAVYAVESFVIALNVSFLNTGIVFFLNIFFATVNAAFTNLSAFDVYKEDFKGFLVFALYVLNVLMVVVKFVFYTFIIAVKLVAILAKDHKEFFAVFAANVAALAAYWSYQKIT